MYTLLSPLSQDSISLDDFVARYQATARTARLTAVEPRILSALKTGLTAQVLYEVSLHSAVDNIHPERDGQASRRRRLQSPNRRPRRLRTGCRAPAGRLSGDVPP